MTAPDLKPCPFCLGKAEAFYIANHEGGLARCADADCIGNRAYGKVSAWNRRADLAAVPAQVRVKPLVWTQIGSSYRAPAPLFGHIRVEDYALGKWSVLWSAPGICDTFTDGAFYTPEAAKAAAQADYEARILAALEPQPNRDLETCGKCMGSGYSGHPDSGHPCADCNGSGGVPQPDPRDEVIARLVEALHANVVYAEKIADAVEIDPDETFLCVKVMPEGREVATRSWSEVLSQARAALAAAKAVQHG